MRQFSICGKALPDSRTRFTQIPPITFHDNFKIGFYLDFFGFYLDFFGFYLDFFGFYLDFRVVLIDFRRDTISLFVKYGTVNSNGEVVMAVTVPADDSTFMLAHSCG